MAGFIDRVEVDFITNGAPEGDLAADMLSGRFTLEPRVGFDPGILRPVIQNDGKKYCKINTGRTVANKKSDPSYVVNEPEGAQVPETKHIPLQRMINNGTVPFTFNASSLPHDTWRRIDTAVIRASRDRLNAWNDLVAANSYSGFDGMSVTAIVRDTMTDSGAAKVDMDTLTDDLNDAPLYDPDILPLPIIHAGAAISQRRLAQSRNAGMPLDTTQLEQCGRRCAETLENITIGMTDLSTLVIGSSTDFTRRGIYGFRTQADRITKIDLTASASFVAETFVSEVIAMRELARAQKFYGPFVLYYSTTWDQYLARDYVVGTSAQGYTTVDKTVLQRVEMIEGITRVAMLDLFTSTDELLLVQMNSETVQAVDGLDWTTVQWTKDGGAQTMLRVMGIKVPSLRAQYVGTSTSTRKSGIVHGTTS
jgi:hypothetical protein